MTELPATIVAILLAGTAPAAVAALQPAPTVSAPVPGTEPRVEVAPAPDWPLPPPAPTAGETPPDAPLRFVYNDYQVRVDGGETHHFIAYRVRILRPEALQLGQVVTQWKPDAGPARVHRVHIIRDGAVTDLTPDVRFTIARNEAQLEQSMLTGLAAATYQVPGLQVGDDLEVWLSIEQRDATIGDHGFGAYQFAPMRLRGAFRFRLLWPETDSMRWRAEGGLPVVESRVAGRRKAIVAEMRDPSTLVMPEGAPARFQRGRRIDYSDFADWQAVSRRFAPLYIGAATLAPDSPVRAEAARIAADTDDPAARAAAALRLVQERIRHVFVGLDGGNFMPAGADETWNRRFGDCKGKTALLLALLAELGIEAEAALVNALGDDGLDAQLPSPAAFNHVLVRATIAGRTHWLDGTRGGDTRLDGIPPPGFRWALPLQVQGAALVHTPPAVPTRPTLLSRIDVDATGGFDKAARIRMHNVVRGDEAYGLRTMLAGMSDEDADRAVRTYWREQSGDWIEPDNVDWTYDPDRQALTLSIDGTGDVDWEGDETAGRSLYVYGAGFTPPARRRRPAEQDQNAPWAIAWPAYRCFATTIRLPKSDAPMRWTYVSEPVDRTLGGVRYWRRASLAGDVMQTVMATRSDVPEISAEEAAQVNGAIAGFNNRKSEVMQTRDTGARTPLQQPLFGADTDWLVDDNPCRPTG